MLHLRVIAPADRSAEAVRLLSADPGVTHLAVLAGAAYQPPGDLILCDVVRESADGVLRALHGLGIEGRGAIVGDDVELTVSAAADRAAREAPGSGADALVWDEVAAKTGEQTELSVTYLVLITVATVLAGIGVLLDQPILIVGAMVVGPEFGPLAALCVALLRRRPADIGRPVIALVVGFLIAMSITVVSTWLLTAGDLVSRDMLLAERPLTNFIWRPDALSWVVGLLAGVAGMLSLTAKKSGSLVGVLISVTTVPAAANVAVATAYGVWHEAAGSALQLMINFCAIVLAGVATLAVQQFWWTLARRASQSAGNTGSGGARKAGSAGKAAGGAPPRVPASGPVNGGGRVPDGR